MTSNKFFDFIHLHNIEISPYSRTETKIKERAGMWYARCPIIEGSDNLVVAMGVSPEEAFNELIRLMPRLW